ncbi:hypothetical protein W02_39430 [Nitrospira sp. KM1]|uniref:hypothetical protein n=1 Tax=Nitrospira sp. KM1 TaxID=1936990 RepID=UPI0013A7B38C|nr:hypothetical protein [Nitrospira sp. KM1]BCA56803.1 hypothetical protein W02_39430 [Nitrospira sp. KM1]
MIEVLKRDSNVILNFRYDGSENPVGITDILVQESNNGPIVWDLKTYDPSMFAEKRRETFDLEKLKKSPIKLLVLSQLVLGIVPNGFRQDFPVLEEQPRFVIGKSYEIFVRGVGHRGREKFTFD